MRNMNIKPYEISLWGVRDEFDEWQKKRRLQSSENIEALNEHLPLYSTEDIAHYQLNSSHNGNIPSYLQEYKILILGSDTMDTPLRAFEPVYKRNINGTEELSFYMFHNYTGDDGKLYENPFIALMGNERKIKLFYEDTWHDFIVREVSEGSEDNKFNYVCKDLATSELGKTGFNIEFNVELENNQASAQALTKATLNGSDWTYRDVNQFVLKERNNEALYSATLNSTLTPSDYTVLNNNPVPVTIAAGSTIYIYYNVLENKTVEYFQFLYVLPGNTPPVLDDHATIDYHSANVLDCVISITNIDDLISNKQLTDYRGDRLVRKQLSGYDPIVDKQILKYTKIIDGAPVEYYAYTDSEYLTSDIVVNYIANGEDFKDAAGWDEQDSSTLMKVDWKIIPDVGNLDSEQCRNIIEQMSHLARYERVYRSYLKVDVPESGGEIFNHGIESNKRQIKNIYRDEEYILAFRFKSDTTAPTDLSAYIATYSYNGEKYTSGEHLFDFTEFSEIQRDVYDITSDIIVDRYKTYYERKDDKWQVVLNPTDEGLIYYYEKYNETWYETSAKCIADITTTDFNDNKYGIFITFPSSSAEYTCYIEGAQLFKKYIDDGAIVYIGDIPTSKMLTYYYYYDPEQAKSVKAIEDIIFTKTLGESDEFIPKYGDGEKAFEKIRSIEEAESNRYNIIQDICETFQCWARFVIEHEDDGHIKLSTHYLYYQIPLSQYEVAALEGNIYYFDKDAGEYLPATFKSDTKQYYSRRAFLGQNKYVELYESEFNNNYSGFKYGINLKNTTRELDSNEITTKIIVAPNNCEYAPNGMCTIADAEENPIKAEYAYNFRYYIQQGILDATMLNQDLYDDEEGRYLHNSIGLYPRIAEWNKNINDLKEKYARLSTINLPRIQSQRDAYQLTADSAAEIISETEDSIEYICSKTWEELSTEVSGIFIATKDETVQDGKVYFARVGSDIYDASSYKIADMSGVTNPYESKLYEARQDFILTQTVNEPSTNDKILNLITTLLLEKSVYNNANNYYNLYAASYDELEEQLTQIENELAIARNNVNAVEAEFTAKYSRFIQEGSWTDEEYMDANLYYLDALNVLNTSAFPKVTYNFGIIDVESFGKGLGLYHFEIGDKTTVEDTEFFGWVGSGINRTPAREEVIISEISSHLDDPSQNEITIQNYKTQFEDLFERVAAATQQLELHSGEYMRAASAITSTGAITSTALQEAIDNGQINFTNLANTSTSFGADGITLFDMTDTRYGVKLNGGGIYITQNGGINWTKAVGGDGINANRIATGNIDTNTVRIGSSDNFTFYWDDKGLNAYDFTLDENDKVVSIDANKFVRFDKYGLYGIKKSLLSGESNYIAHSLEDIQNDSIFSLTWKGFTLRGEEDDGQYIDISSENGIRVRTWDNNHQVLIDRIKIGKIDNDGLYGMRILDGDGNTALVTSDDGKLYLKSLLTIGDGIHGVLKFGADWENIKNEIYSLTSDTKYNPDKIYFVFDNNEYRLANANELANFEDNDFYILSNGIYPVIQSINNDVHNFTLYSNGLLRANGAIIDGTIYAQNGKFSGTLQANKIIASVFQQDQITVTGGKMIFKQGYKVKSVSPEDNLIVIDLGDSDDDDKEEDINLNPTQIIENIILPGSYFLLNDYGAIVQADVDRYCQFILTNDETVQAGKIYYYLNTDNIMVKSEAPVDSSAAGLYENLAYIIVDSSSDGPFYKYNYDNSIWENWADNDDVNNKYTANLNYYAYNENVYTKQSLIKVMTGIDEDQHTIEDDWSDFEFKCNNVTWIASGNETDKKAVIIASNSEDTDYVMQTTLFDTLNNESILMPQGITISEFNYDGRETISVRTFLGNLNSVKDQIHLKDGEDGGYGLYSDNVYLHGKLTTNNGEAGIDTHSGIISDKFDDDGEIALWAGKTKNISDAPFQVTTTGKLYARDGIFEGSIYGSDIYTARIHGWDQQNYSANPLIAPLTIFNDAGAGIVFASEPRDLTDSNPYANISPHLVITNNSLYYHVPEQMIASFDDSHISLFSLSKGQNGKSSIQLTGDEIIATTIDGNSDTSSNAGIHMQFNDNNEIQIQINEIQTAILNNNSLKLANGIAFSLGNKMQYMPFGDYYNLVVN